MSYKIKEIFEKIKKKLPLYVVLWAFIVVVMLGCSYSIRTMQLQNDSLDLGKFTQYFGNLLDNPGQTLGTCFTSNYIDGTLKCFVWTTVVFIIVLAIVVARNWKNMEYRDIEHGSSDWSKGGEQYRTLSNKKGIILAEDNYLPLDKRGNINVLIVGRIWIW